jgi:glycosyltransferase involved in cell wall biosynthesis
MVLPEIGYGDRLERRFDRIVRGNLTRVDVIASVCRWIRTELERMGTTARIVDIPNGVPWEAFQQAPGEGAEDLLRFGAGSLVVLSVGRHQRVKGFDLGLRAFARVAAGSPRAVYVLVGRDVSKLADLVRELGLGSRVRLIEELPQARLPALFRGADVFFSPSLMEGFSQVNAQALASGLPLVLTDAPGNRDAGDGGGALIAESANVDSMAAALGTLLGDGALRRKLSADAHSAGKRYAWSRIASEYLGVFEELTAARSPRAG